MKFNYLRAAFKAILSSDLITRWLDSGRHAQQLMKRNAFKRLLCYEGLEDRRLLAVTSLSSGILTIDFNLVSESVTVGNDGANIRLIGSTFTGAGSTFATAAVTGLQVTDSGNLGSQSLVFAGIATFTLADGLSSSGIETVRFDNAVTATGTSSLMISAPQSITVSKPIASSGGNLSLLANNGLTLNNSVNSAGGNLVLRADADGDGIGLLSLAPAVLNSWSEQQTLTASDGKASDVFGWRTSLSADGNTAIVGTNSNKGLVTVFFRSGGVWIEQQTLIGPANRLFGDAVALSGDGNTAFVGARTDNSATVFVRSGGVWSQQIRLTGGAAFGRSVALSFDGNTAVVGADMDLVGGIASGSATVFVRSAGMWSLQQKFTLIGPMDLDQFGYSVVLSADGNTALVGSRNDNVNGYIAQGSATIYVRAGGLWSLQQLLTINSERELFGRSTALSADGNTALFGLSFHDVGTKVDQGAATVYIRNGGVWTEQQTFLASDGEEQDIFGEKVALSADGNTALIGAPGDDVNGKLNQGSARVFVRSGGVWTEQQTLIASDGEAGDSLGFHVSLSADGKTALVAAITDDVGANINQGSARTFVLSSTPGGSVAALGGTITLTASDIDIQGNIQSSAQVFIVTEKSGRQIDLGSNSANTLGLTDAELDRITASTIKIGDSNTGTISVTADLTQSGKNLSLTSALGVTGSGAIINGSPTPTTLSINQNGNSSFAGLIGGASGGSVGDKNISFVKSGSGNLTLTGANTYTGATTISGTGTLSLSSSSTNNLAGSTIVIVQLGSVLDVIGLSNSAILLTNGQTLSGEGRFVGSIVAGSGSHVSPGASPGILNTANLTFQSGSHFDLELNGIASGTQFDQLNVVGTVSLGGSTLDVTLGFNSTVGNTFKIINNDLVDAVTGTFDGLPEGQIFSITTGSFSGNFQITYVGGDGNDVVLKSVVAVVNRKVYYKGSSFASGGVDSALDPNKVLAQSGAAPQTLSYSNLINTTRGINGIVLDVAGLASATLTASDFSFRVSPTGFFDEAANPPSSWAAAPAPTSIFVTPATATTPARVQLEWADNAIENRWLQIRVVANANTGLLSSPVYYLGHLRGEINGQTVGGAYFVSNADLTAALPVGQVALVGNTRDVDKNGFVLNADFIIIRLGIINGLLLRNITIPAAGSADEGAAMRPERSLLGSIATPMIESKLVLSLRQPMRAAVNLDDPAPAWVLPTETIESKIVCFAHIEPAKLLITAPPRDAHSRRAGTIPKDLDKSRVGDKADKIFAEMEALGDVGCWGFFNERLTTDKVSDRNGHGND